MDSTIALLREAWGGSLGISFMFLCIGIIAMPMHDETKRNSRLMALWYMAAFPISAVVLLVTHRPGLTALGWLTVFPGLWYYLRGVKSGEILLRRR